MSCEVKYIVFACGTNSSLTLPVVRKLYSVPMIGLVGPGAGEAVRSTRNGRIGVIATEATIKSGAYQDTIKALAPDAAVFARFAPRLVTLVEAGLSKSNQAWEAVLEYARPLKEANVDTLILGCTHYPFLSSFFTKYLGPQVKLINPAKATVLAAGQEMGMLNILNRGGGPVSHRYYVSGNPREFLKTARQLGYNLNLVHQLRLEGAGCASAGPPGKEECSEVV
jgi:glutamate racemase